MVCSKLIETARINSARNVHEKAVETFSQFEETCYELICPVESKLNFVEYMNYVAKKYWFPQKLFAQK